MTHRGTGDVKSEADEVFIQKFTCFTCPFLQYCCGFRCMVFAADIMIKQTIVPTIRVPDVFGPYFGLINIALFLIGTVDANAKSEFDAQFEMLQLFIVPVTHFSIIITCPDELVDSFAACDQVFYLV